MSAEERLIRYCQIDTQSDPESKASPSNNKVCALAKILNKELLQLGVKDATTSNYGFVYGHLESNTEKKCPTVGFIAHMDTAPDFTGTNVKPRIIRKYSGKDIVLNKKRTMKVRDFPQLKKYVGDDLMVTDGNTLLGADDKAGVAAIMDAVEYLTKHPEVKHGRIAIAFTPDEEVGRGTEHFDLKKFGASFAYTIDGDDINTYSDETFNAAEVNVTFKGFSIHPGEAKNKMINAINLAWEFHSSLPVNMRPEYTEGREGFFHLGHMQGNVEEAHLQYIVRNHSSKEFSQQLALLKETAQFINHKQRSTVVTLDVHRQYKNMIEVLKKNPQATKAAVKAFKALGMDAKNIPIRGGTDGSMLSFKGLPCPNLGAGGGNFHGPYEYCNLTQLKKVTPLIIAIINAVEEGTK